MLLIASDCFYTLSEFGSRGICSSEVLIESVTISKNRRVSMKKNVQKPLRVNRFWKCSRLTETGKDYLRLIVMASK